MGFFDKIKTKISNIVEDINEDIERNIVFSDEQLDLYEKVVNNFSSMTADNVNEWKNYCNIGGEIIDDIDHLEFDRLFAKRSKKLGECLVTDFGTFHKDIKTTDFYEILKSIYTIRSGGYEYGLCPNSYGNYILFSEQYMFLFNSIRRTLDEELPLYRQLETILRNINKEKFSEYILVRATKNDFPTGYNTEFGYYYDVKNAYEYLESQISYDVINVPKFIKVRDDFNKKLLSIHKHEINIKSGNKSTKK